MSTSASASIEATATRRRSECHLPRAQRADLALASGRGGSLPQVLLTINEKRHARQSRDLAIATGGDLRHTEPWRIDEGDLEPVQFRWSPREAGPAT